MAETGPNDLHAMAARLIELREALGLTQAEFARRIEVKPQNVANWEKARNRPSYNICYRIRMATGGVPPDYVLTGNENGMPLAVWEKIQEHRRKTKTGSQAG